jgi:DNA modification methylase
MPAFDIGQKVDLKYLDPAELVPYENNSRTHSDSQIAEIAVSIAEFGFLVPILIDSKTRTIIAGHGRLLAAQKLKMDSVPVLIADHLTEVQRRAYVIADNKLALKAGWDYKALGEELSFLQDNDFAFEITGFNVDDLAEMLDEDFDKALFESTKDPEQSGAAYEGETEEDEEGETTAGEKEVHRKLNDYFVCPPFSVLNTTLGYWMERRAYWQQIIQDKGESREGALSEATLMKDINSGVSILDAVLAECLARWFTLPNSNILDPFAGDTVFGFVSGYLGHNFTGIELRQEQASLNQERTDRAGLNCNYICDTSENMDAHVSDETMDFIFSCPPYADLEVYSDDPRDLSNMSHEDFFKLYSGILGNTFKKLKNNRFAAIVTSEVRGKDGAFINLVPRTIEAMQAAGFKYYNEMILLNQVGTNAQRVGRYMNSGRKVGRIHQNILVFYKGDTAEIKNVFPDLIGEDCETIHDEGQE